MEIVIAKAIAIANPITNSISIVISIVNQCQIKIKK
jgi:hypothetical protein